jgi:hypothetical protein
VSVELLVTGINGCAGDKPVHDDPRRENTMDAVGTALLERCARIGTSTWSDALDEFGIEGVRAGRRRRLYLIVRHARALWSTVRCKTPT